LRKSRKIDSVKLSV